MKVLHHGAVIDSQGYRLALKVSQMKLVELANNVDPDEVALNEGVGGGGGKSLLKQPCHRAVDKREYLVKTRDYFC